LVYGVVEFVLAYAIPGLFRSDVELLTWQLRPIALIFGVYALLGAVVGGTSGAVLAWAGGVRQHRDSTRPYEIIAALGLTVLFAANLLTAGPLRISDYVGLGIAGVLAILFVGALMSSAALERVAFLANPCGLSLLLLTVPWVSRAALTSYPGALKARVCLLLLGITLLLATLWQRLRSAYGDELRRQAMLGGAATFLLVGAVVFARGPLNARGNQETKSAQPARPNVVLITMDTVRADHLSLYGYARETTPYLRDFARHATLYSRAIATSDQTLTTHASMFTGLYPSWHGAYIKTLNHPNGGALDDRYTTLAEVLRGHGYWTVAEVANYVLLAPETGLAKGFAVYHARQPFLLSLGLHDFRNRFFLMARAGALLNLVLDTSVFDGRLLRAADINRHAVALLDEARNTRQPFFLFLNYMDAHAPYTPPPPFDLKFGGAHPHLNAGSIVDLTTAVDSGRHHINAQERSYFISQYDGGIAYEDEQIHDLMARLRDLGLFENTLIVITADHGEAFGEHDLIQHSTGSVYQGLVHVPLLIKYPHQHEARKSDPLVSEVDLMPTVLDVAGISLPFGLQGRSLYSPPAEDLETVYSESMASPSLVALNSKFRGSRCAMFVGPVKVITSTEGLPELYDLAADPNETHNLYRADDSRAKALADRLSTWEAAAPRQFEEPGKLDQSSLEKLRSLGYVQ